VFATVVIAFLFTRLKLLQVATATRAVLFSTVIFLSGGIIGTFHHLYFTGLPSVVLGLGASFSALEVVPLILIGFEAWENIRLSRAKSWLSAYRWPIYFFVAVAFWNFVGAGLFVFLINPPIALYYMQGLNTTAVHGHTALFGVYGMLGIGLMLFCLRALQPGRMEGLAAEDILLDHQYRTGVDGVAQPAHRLDANLGVCRIRNVVCTILRIPSERLHERSAVDATVRRYPLRNRRAHPRRICAGAFNRPLLQQYRPRCCR
jgi:hypothetical protein